MEAVTWLDFGQLLALLTSLYISLLTLRRIWHEHDRWIHDMATEAVTDQMCKRWADVVLRRFAAVRPRSADAADHETMTASFLSGASADAAFDPFDPVPPSNSTERLRRVSGCALPDRAAHSVQDNVRWFVGVRDFQLLPTETVEDVVQEAVAAMRARLYCCYPTRRLRLAVHAAYLRVNADLANKLSDDYMRCLSMLVKLCRRLNER